MSQPEDSRSRTERAALVAAYALAGLCLLRGYGEQLNPDAISYLASARKYLAGDFTAAATAFWSPLYTWLLAVPLAVGVPALPSAKLVDLLSGAVALLGTWRLLSALQVDRVLRVAASATAIPVLLGFALTVATPDLLACAIVLHLLADLAGARWWTLPHAGPRIGLLMAAAYLAKAYALGFVAVHFALVLALDLWRTPDERARIARRGAIALATLLVVAGAWASVLGLKYGRPLAGAAGTLSWGLDGPGNPGYPMQRDGFLPLPDPAAQSAWDDPTLLSLPSWNALGSPEERAHFRGLVRRNLAELAAIALHFSPLAAVVAVLTALLAGSRRDPLPRRPAALLALAALVLPAGYVLLHLRERFLSALCVLLLVLGTFAMGVLRSWVGERWRTDLAAAVFFASFLAAPVGALRASWGDGRQWKALARAFETAPSGSLVASNGRWRQSLYVSFHRGWRYLGEPKPNAPPKQVKEELWRHEAAFFLAWNDGPQPPFLSTWDEVARAPGIARLYRVRPAADGK
ncbi:MAG: hypothetical protein ABW221_25305 [Vicinamibacteria bacterium]